MHQPTQAFTPPDLLDEEPVIRRGTPADRAMPTPVPLPPAQQPEPAAAASWVDDEDAEPRFHHGDDDEPLEFRRPLPRRRTEAIPPPPRRGRRPPPRARMPGQPASPPRGGQPRRRAGRRILALLALLAIGAALFLINATFQPFHSEGSGAVGVTIPEGADASRIGDRLAAAGVVDSGRFFMLNATLTGRRGKLKPGEYTLPRNMSNGDAVEALQQGPKARIVKTFDVTVPEGRSIREAAPLIEDSPVRGDYLKAAASRRTIRRARRLGLPANRRNAEGFLFPATYELVSDATAQQLVDRQLKAFSDNLSKIDMRVAKRRNLTRYDVVIIASMVERETQLDRERPIVASVIHNRLRDGIPLGIDATTRYFENNWTRPLRQSELQRDSPYNTRENRGLPPTPIGSPGLKSLQAAAKPANTKYLYYVVKPGTRGHAFSSTDAQFQRDVARYNAARESRGGESPTDR